MTVNSQPTDVHLHFHELDWIFDEVEQALGAEKAQKLRQLLDSHRTLTQWLQEKNISIARLRRLLFGPQTERTRNAAGGRSESPSPSTQDAAPPDTGVRGDDGSKESASGVKGRRGRPNHGRISAQGYMGCERVVVTHEAILPGAPCPHCQEGTLYRQKDWAQVVRLIGQPPVGGRRYKADRRERGSTSAIACALNPRASTSIRASSILCEFRWALSFRARLLAYFGRRACAEWGRRLSQDKLVDSQRAKRRISATREVRKT